MLPSVYRVHTISYPICMYVYAFIPFTLIFLIGYWPEIVSLETLYGMVMAPIQIGKWFIFFCDEINLPNLDKYGM